MENVNTFLKNIFPGADRSFFKEIVIARAKEVLKNAKNERKQHFRVQKDFFKKHVFSSCFAVFGRCKGIDLYRHQQTWYQILHSIVIHKI